MYGYNGTRSATIFVGGALHIARKSPKNVLSMAVINWQTALNRRPPGK
jgi:hypothetical protein